MKRNNVIKLVIGTVVTTALFFGVGMSMDKNNVQAGNQLVKMEDEPAKDGEATPTPIPDTLSGALSGAGIDGEPTPQPTATPDMSAYKLNKTSLKLCVGKKYTLKFKNETKETIEWSTANKGIASVTDKGVVKGVAVGTTTVTAKVLGKEFSCKVTVLKKITQKDFGTFDKVNFVLQCKRKGWDRGYAWNGQWKGDSKKKKTARGIKIGKTYTQVKNAYGELDLKKVSAKDPFTFMKGLKRNKVKYYNDITYSSKYRIRFYYNSKKKVVAIIFSCNAKKIKKKYLRSYL